MLSTCSLLSLATVTSPNSCESILNASKVQHEHACCAVIFTVRVVCVVLAQQPTTAIHNCSCARVRQTPQTLLRTHCDLILKLDTLKKRKRTSCLRRLMQTQLMQFFEILSLQILQILQVLLLAELVLFLADASPPSLGPPNG